MAADNTGRLKQRIQRGIIIPLLVSCVITIVVSAALLFGLSPAWLNDPEKLSLKEEKGNLVRVAESKAAFSEAVLRAVAVDHTIVVSGVAKLLTGKAVRNQNLKSYAGTSLPDYQCNTVAESKSRTPPCADPSQAMVDKVPGAEGASASIKGWNRTALPSNSGTPLSELNRSSA